jgi:lysophospholipase L1-like esterase
MNFLIKKFSSIILIISFLSFIYIFYRSEIFWDGNNRNYFKTYYLISSILIFFSIITFFINNKIKQYLIITGISLVVSLYLFEGYLILKEQLSKERLYENQTGNKWDKRSRLEIYNDLKKINNEIVVSVTPKDYTHKDYSFTYLSGISNAKTIFCNENGYYSIYQSDRYGFNNPDNEWDKKEIEYFLVGDSFTHGSCVNRPNDISSVLRNLSNKSVLNLGMSGTGPLIEYATLREYLNKNAKKILWIYYEGNDLAGIESEKKNNTLINYLKDLNFTQNLKLKQNEIDILARKLIEKQKEREKEKNIIKLIRFIKISNTRYLILPSPAPAPLLEFKKILRLAKELTNKNNSKLYFVYLPEYSRYIINYDNTNYNSVKNIITELKIPFIDVHKEVFEKEQNPLKLFPFEPYGHYNVDGYKKVAETIYKLTKY